MHTLFVDKFQVKTDASFRCDNPIFDFIEAALDCYNKAIEMMIRWDHHDVKISIVQLVTGGEIPILNTFIE